MQPRAGAYRDRTRNVKAAAPLLLSFDFDVRRARLLSPSYRPHLALACALSRQICRFPLWASQCPANLHKLDMVRTTSPNRMRLPARRECAFIVACSGCGRMFRYSVRAPQVADS